MFVKSVLDVYISFADLHVDLWFLAQIRISSTSLSYAQLLITPPPVFLGIKVKQSKVK